MDSDRRSNVSSFYRGRKDSFDPLSGAADPTPRERDDSSSSFFQPTLQNHPANMMPSAGYNRESFLDPGRTGLVRGLHEDADQKSGGGEFGVRQSPAPDMSGGQTEVVEDPGWDVYNDFNNVGPKYSDAFGTGLGSLNSNPASYQPLPNDPPTPRTGKFMGAAGSDIESGARSTGSANQTEFVTVPALGPDWKKSEILGMRKSTKREEVNDERRRKFKLWWRDQHGLCGGFLTRKVLVIILFVICVAVGIVLAVTYPRSPSYSFNIQSPVTNDTQSSAPSTFSRSPANFSFPALVNIQVDTSSAVISTHITGIDAQLFCLDTDAPIGGGHFNGTTIAAHKFQPISIPVMFNYSAVNDSDTTWLQFYNACRNPSQYSDGVRPGFNIHLLLTTHIAGLLSTIASSTQITKVNCPFELPNNSV